jgi:hypothetical protein
MCIDTLLVSVIIFPYNKETKIVLSTYRDINNAIVKDINGGETQERSEVYTRAFRASLETVLSVVEKEIDRTLDRYERLYKGAKKEAAERMYMGFFGGGVALLGWVAVWNDDVDGRSGWKETMLER